MILVTGGAGYIGSHTVVELLNNGYKTIIVDNFSNSGKESLIGIEKITNKKPIFYQEDVCDYQKMEEIVKKHEINAIIHFAAHKAVGESVENPLKYYNNNVVSLLNLLKLMKEYKIPSLVFSSSCTVYGEPDLLPVTEQSPIKKATSPYGNTKQIAETMINDSIEAYKGINAICLRYFNPIGAHKSALIGELPSGVPDNLIPYITQTAIGIRNQLQIFGNDYNTPDGTCIRDYIHITDLAKAHVVAIKRLLENSNKSDCETFNIGTGNGTSVYETVKSFEKATGEKINYKFVPRRSGDVEKVYADATYANIELGWKAELSLEDALLSAWNWEKYYRNKNK